MTPIITGSSNIKEAFMPNRTFPCGSVKGESDADVPVTRTKLKRFAPIIFPKDKEPCPFIREVTAVTNSGRLVPKAINVSAMTDSLTPNASAINVPLSINKLLPIAINTAPKIKTNIFLYNTLFPSDTLLVLHHSSV